MSTFLGEKNKAEYEAELRTAIAEKNDSFRRAAMKGIKSTDGKAVRTQGRCRPRQSDKSIPSSTDRSLRRVHRDKRPTR